MHSGRDRPAAARRCACFYLISDSVYHGRKKMSLKMEEKNNLLEIGHVTVEDDLTNVDNGNIYKGSFKNYIHQHEKTTTILSL